MQHEHQHGPNFRDVVHTIGEDYEFRIPLVLKQMAVVGLVAVGAALLIQNRIATAAMLIVGAFLFFPFLIVWLVIRSIRQMRLTLRDRMVSQVNWHGDEQVLDVGTGSGITLIGCAKHLTTGKAIGIDIWDPNAGGGTPEIFWKNVHANELADRVDLQRVDARQMPYEDESFDVIVSSFAVHHMGSPADIQRATQEMIRVLKPGGKIIICDVTWALQTCETTLRQAKLTEVARVGRVVNRLTAKKPA